MVKEKMPKVELYEDVQKVLKDLKQIELKIAVISSSLRDYITPAINYHGIHEFFDLIVIGEDVIKHKPDAEGINLVVKKLDANKKSAIMIGDSDKDILAAKGAKIDSILFYPPEHQLFYDFKMLTRSNPTHTAKNFDEIYKFIIN